MVVYMAEVHDEENIDIDNMNDNDKIKKGHYIRRYSDENQEGFSVTIIDVIDGKKVEREISEDLDRLWDTNEYKHFVETLRNRGRGTRKRRGRSRTKKRKSRRRKSRRRKSKRRKSRRR